jgi:6-pyruvoyl-tetrahydropterin synthase
MSYPYYATGWRRAGLNHLVAVSKHENCKDGSIKYVIDILIRPGRAMKKKTVYDLSEVENAVKRVLAKTDSAENPEKIIEDAQYLTYYLGMGPQ